MSRDTSPYIVGEHWLDYRRDGKSPGIWQIATYKPGSRSVVYRSTHTRSLDEAKAEINAHHEAQQARRPQEAHDARVIPVMMVYWQERGQHAIKPDQIASSIRQFMGFLFQDEATMNAVVTDLTPALFERFRRWRMGPHEYNVPWGDKDYAHTSKGVRGESVQRNIDDIRAAILYAEKNRRLPMAPKIENLESRWRSQSRDNLLTYGELGRIYWYAKHFPELFRYIALMLGTAARPEAVAKFDPARQFDSRTGLIDTQHPDAPITNKRNQFIPAIRPLRVVLEAWARDGAKPALSRKSSWRTMRAAIGLSPVTVAKDIRYTIATELYSDPDVPERQIAELLGHAGNLHRTTKRYAKYRPERMQEVAKALTTIWLRVSREARAFRADHLLTKEGRADKIKVAKRGQECQDLCAFKAGGR